MKKILKNIFTGFALLMVAVVNSSCYKQFADAPYPAQTIYMPTATNGIYAVNSVAVAGQTYRYTVDPIGAKLAIPLSAYRSGLNSDGDVNVNVAVRTDTISTLLSSGALANGTLLLPATAYTIPSSVVIPGGGVLGQFGLSIDLNFLLANTTKTYAVAVGISSSQVQATTKNVTIIVITPAFLIPTANFTSALSSTARQYNFTNTSGNAVSYSWNFGDGSASVPDKSPSHLYNAAGTYTVTLTTTGAAGAINPAVKTAVLVVQ